MLCSNILCDTICINTKSDMRLISLSSFHAVQAFTFQTFGHFFRTLRAGKCKFPNFEFRNSLTTACMQLSESRSKSRRFGKFRWTPCVCRKNGNITSFFLKDPSSININSITNISIRSHAGQVGLRNTTECFFRVSNRHGRPRDIVLACDSET